MNILHLHFDENFFIEFSKKLSHILFQKVREYYNQKFLSGVNGLEYSTYNDNTYVSLKAEHKIDQYAKSVIMDFIHSNYFYLWEKCNIFMEDFYSEASDNLSISIYIDPVDGSRSADLNIGDPCFMIAYAEKASASEAIKFKDLKSCFIKCLKSGDQYFTYENFAYYIPGEYSFNILDGKILLNNKQQVAPIKLKNDVYTLEQAVVIIREGYGMRKFAGGKINFDVLDDVKHCFSYDITGTELCYLASGRGIADIMVEARKHIDHAQKARGSDGFNMIPYPLIKAAGGMMYTLTGKKYEDIEYCPHKMYDFIAASNERLLKNFLQKGIKKLK